jgi:deazaflavin-dependent oxidoreductase (nitroreductase family)
VNVFLKLATAVHIWLYRSSGGKRASRVGKHEFVLLTTRGRKTGAERTVLVLSFADGPDRLVVASASGARKDPAWFLNVQANPRVTVQLGPDVYAADAIIPAPLERDRLWKQILGEFPTFEKHEKKAGRTIPVVRLVRVLEAAQKRRITA